MFLGNLLRPARRHSTRNGLEWESEGSTTPTRGTLPADILCRTKRELEGSVVFFLVSECCKENASSVESAKRLRNKWETDCTSVFVYLFIYLWWLRVSSLSRWLGSVVGSRTESFFLWRFFSSFFCSIGKSQNLGLRTVDSAVKRPRK